MRIAISGTHFSGKSTLMKALNKELPNYESINEAYVLLEEEGYEFHEPPSLEEFEQMIKKAVSTIRMSKKNTIFDRTPLDYYAYALAISKGAGFEEEVDTESLIEEMADAMKQIDLVVFIPIEYPDRILVPSSQDKRLRLAVDEKLQELLFEDPLGILDHSNVLEVDGALKERLKLVLDELQVLR